MAKRFETSEIEAQQNFSSIFKGKLLTTTIQALPVLFCGNHSMVFTAFPDDFSMSSPKLI